MGTLESRSGSSGGSLRTTAPADDHAQGDLARTRAARLNRPARSAVALKGLGGIAALLTTAVLLLGLVGVAIQPQAMGPRNWLVVLFQINSGFGSLPSDPLHLLNPLDVALLALVGLTFLGLWPALGRQHRIWTGIAIVLPFAGITLLLVNGLEGRSALMSAGLVIAVLVLASGRRGWLLASIGLAANVLLLAGDLGTDVLAGGLVAASVGVGYVLLLAWSALLALSLLWPPRVDGPIR